MGNEDMFGDSDRIVPGGSGINIIPGKDGGKGVGDITGAGVGGDDIGGGSITGALSGAIPFAGKILKSIKKAVGGGLCAIFVVGMIIFLMMTSLLTFCSSGSTQTSSSQEQGESSQDTQDSDGGQGANGSDNYRGVPDEDLMWQ